MKELKGISVSQGVVTGKVFIFNDAEFYVPKYCINKDHLKKEISRFKNACDRVEADLQEIKKSLEKDLLFSEAKLIDSHIFMVKDPELISQVEIKITEKFINAEFAIKKVSENIINILKKTEDSYLMDRIYDIKDITKRLIEKLNSVQRDGLSNFEEDVIIIAHNILPSDTMSMDKKHVKGFITEIGGRTSHTAILARSFEIPAIVGISDLLKNVSENDKIILDAVNGKIIINPDSETEEKYDRYIKNWYKKESELLSLNNLPAETKDGKLIKLNANIEVPEEVYSVLAHGADGIGLYRSEFLLMNRDYFYDEDFQYTQYCKVLDEMQGKPVIIRTFDMGGDKVIKKLSIDEDNPILGWRSIRFCMGKPDIFRVQLRALFRAGFNRNLSIMFPMISGAGELDDVLEFVEKIKGELKTENINFNPDMPIGIMIEIPAAAMTSDILARNTDFFSIGTNDLIQYTIAVDRGNQKTAYLYEPFHPGVLRLINLIVENGHQEGISVSLCGEMGGDVLNTVVLVGLGLDSISMSPARIPAVKQIIRAITVTEAEKLVAKIIKMSNAKDIEKFVKEWLSERLGIKDE